MKTLLVILVLIGGIVAYNVHTSNVRNSQAVAAQKASYDDCIQSGLYQTSECWSDSMTTYRVVKNQ